MTFELLFLKCIVWIFLLLGLPWIFAFRIFFWTIIVWTFSYIDLCFFVAPVYRIYLLFLQYWVLILSDISAFRIMSSLLLLYYKVIFWSSGYFFSIFIVFYCHQSFYSLTYSLSFITNHYLTFYYCWFGHIFYFEKGGSTPNDLSTHF